MTQPFYTDGQATFYQGDVIERLREMPENSVHTCVTSPPYWGLRDYGVDGQLGIEATPEEFIEKMVAVFREVRRVLREDGTLWLNIGDSYASARYSEGRTPETASEAVHGDDSVYARRIARNTGINHDRDPQCKPKDLVGIPWMLAFALRADGWYLRQDIIWAKPNPMPESVTDRCTKAHEYLFLLTKSARYFYDQEAIREAYEMSSWTAVADRDGGTARFTDGIRSGAKGAARAGGAADGSRYGATSMMGAYANGGRNKRSVWTIATEAYSAAHFATFPTALVKPCILAGTSERGVCSQCGGPWLREVERDSIIDARPMTTGAAKKEALGEMARTTPQGRTAGSVAVTTLGWAPSCKHEAPTIPATVLDPFLGSGTTAYVAKSLGRHAVGIDLNPEYLELARRRCAQMGLM